MKHKLRTCNICLQDKKVKEFVYLRPNRGRKTTCRECENSNYKKRDFDNYDKWMKQYRQTPKNKEYEREFRKNYLQTLPGVAGKLCSSAKRRAKLNNLEFNLTPEWVKEQLTLLKCSVTNIDLVIGKYDNRLYRVNPYAPSIDRKDPSIGYTMDNCRIVCWIYNLCKADFPEAIVLEFAKAYVSNNCFNELIDQPSIPSLASYTSCCLILSSVSIP